MFADKKLVDKLTPEQRHVCVDRGTEEPFSGRFLHNEEKGTYNCVVCGNQLFSSSTKFDSGTGWPSFWDVIKNGMVKLQEDTNLGMVRTEVVCAKCGAHLGHLFDDGPRDPPRRAGEAGKTGKRYCINSVALDFEIRYVK